MISCWRYFHFRSVTGNGDDLWMIIETVNKVNEVIFGINLTIFFRKLHSEALQLPPLECSCSRSSLCSVASGYLVLAYVLEFWFELSFKSLFTPLKTGYTIGVKSVKNCNSDQNIITPLNGTITLSDECEVSSNICSQILPYKTAMVWSLGNHNNEGTTHVQFYHSRCTQNTFRDRLPFSRRSGTFAAARNDHLTFNLQWFYQECQEHVQSQVP